MVCTLQRKVAILESPIVTSLETSAALAAACAPIKVLLDPVVRLFVPVCPDWSPIQVLLSPVVISAPA